MARRSTLPVILLLSLTSVLVALKGLGLVQAGRLTRRAEYIADRLERLRAGSPTRAKPTFQPVDKPYGDAMVQAEGLNPRGRKMRTGGQRQH